MASSAGGVGQTSTAAEIGPTEKQPDDPSRVWLPQLVERFASFLHSNEVACSLRLACKAMVEQFNSPKYTTVQLSQPVPHHAFVRRWGNAAALRPLTWAQRRQLLQLTARSGSLANLEVLFALTEHCPLQPDVLEAAAGAGHLAVCQALRQRGCPWSAGALDAAAAGGHRAMCEWLLASGCPWSKDAPGKAAGGGHVRLTDWLLSAAPTPDGVSSFHLIWGAADGCDLATLQRLYEAWMEPGFLSESPLPKFVIDLMLRAAICSSTSDWQAKVQWLEARGFGKEWRDTEGLFRREDWRSRMEWLRQRGHTTPHDLALGAIRAGNVDVLDDLISEGLLPEWYFLIDAARHGHVHALHLLSSRGPLPPQSDTEMAFAALGGAVWSGHIPAAEWLVERLGGGALEGRVSELAWYGAHSGSLAMLQWLHDRGCRWDDEKVFAVAANVGSEEQLEWLAERGCAMGDDGAPYVMPAVRGDLATLRCLRRLGCPWSDSDWKTFTQAARAVARDHIEWHCPRPAGLAWLLEQGYPVDWAQVERLEPGLEPGVVEWLRGVQQLWRQQRAASAETAVSAPATTS